MRAADLGSKRVGIWGVRREGQAAIRFLRRHHPRLPLLVFDDAADPSSAEGVGGGIELLFGEGAAARAIAQVEVIVKSPGVSLYRPEIAIARKNGIEITSLLNLWFAEPRSAQTICVTGTKGKSTTASLIAHLLAAAGRRVALTGNIGVAITETDTSGAEFVVIEMSSYQAADFTGAPDLAVLTSLHPEHLDWHGSVENYFRDKLRLLARARRRLLPASAVTTAAPYLPPAPEATVLFDDEAAIHAQSETIFDGGCRVGAIPNPYLCRRHNASNLCAALAALKLFGGDLRGALAASAGFAPLPHRQQELGLVGGVLAVDDSISTTPESALAALETYAGREVTLILGGFDRGIDYGGLLAALSRGAAKRVICLDKAGRRIREEAARLPQRPESASFLAAGSMAEAVASALQLTPRGGVILLSPAAPSYGSYRDFIERGRDFAVTIGLPSP